MSQCQGLGGLLKSGGGVQVVGTLENLFKFIAASSSTLDIAIDTGAAAEVSTLLLLLLLSAL